MDVSSSPQQKYGDIPDESKEKIKLRLSRAMGHLNSVCKMVDEKGGMEVLNQLKAVQVALDRTAEILLAEHIEVTLRGTFQDKQQESKTLDDLLKLYRRTREP